MNVSEIFSAQLTLKKEGENFDFDGGEVVPLHKRSETEGSLLFE